MRRYRWTLCIVCHWTFREIYLFWFLTSSSLKWRFQRKQKRNTIVQNEIVFKKTAGTYKCILDHDIICFFMWFQFIRILLWLWSMLVCILSDSCICRDRTHSRSIVFLEININSLVIYVLFQTILMLFLRYILNYYVCRCFPVQTLFMLIVNRL